MERLVDRLVAFDIRGVRMRTGSKGAVRTLTLVTMVHDSTPAVVGQQVDATALPYEAHRFAQAELAVRPAACEPLVELRTTRQTKRRFCTGRHQHTSYARLHDGRRNLQYRGTPSAATAFTPWAPPFTTSHAPFATTSGAWWRCSRPGRSGWGNPHTRVLVLA